MLNNLQMILENSKVEASTDALPLVNTVLNVAVFRPMLFSTPMVQALLNGTKTQTRRLVKFPSDYYGGEVYPNGTWGLKYETKDDCGSEIIKRVYPKFNIGDIIWVRETYCDGLIVDRGGNETPKILYKATYNNEFEIYDHDGELMEIKWKPSLFMPKEACRLWLKVTNVRAEKLNEITETDAVNEGVGRRIVKTSIGQTYIGYENYNKMQADDVHYYRNPAFSFESLWEKINGKGSWNINPWVFVYDFEVTTVRPYGFI